MLEIRPKLIVEIGVWNGASVRTMAECLRDQAIDGAVLAVDTWLGSAEHWIHEPSSLCFAQGRPGKQFVFMANVVEWGLVEHVVPLPLDSLNAADLLRLLEVSPDMIHLDGAHDYESVAADLRSWWPRLKPGGVLIGDDYHDDPNHWPGVRRAFDEFFGAIGLQRIEHHSGKCRVRKPMRL